MQVFVSDSRISVYIDVDTWVLVMMKVRGEDEGTYECHVNSDPPQKLAIHLIVQGVVFDTLIIINYFVFCCLVPIMKVMDGFGRHLRDQYYKAGSSLEVVCEVSFLTLLDPLFWILVNSEGGWDLEKCLKYALGQ